MKLSKRLVSIGALGFPFVLFLGGCPSNPDKNDSGAEAGVACTATNTGGAVMGTGNNCLADGGMAQGTDPASCHPEAGPDPDAGPPEPYGDPQNGSEGDDDDCKYHLKWSSTPICIGSSVTFTVTITRKSDGKPAAGAAPYVELAMLPSHVGPPTKPMTTETQPGVYTIGPHILDAPGKWYVRFHMFGSCEDTLETSPHGHAAFNINVP